PGFASAGSRALGHWFEVTLPDGQKQTIQKTDVGPAGVVDLNAAAASRAYPGGPSTVPSGRATTRYIGPNLPPDVKPTSAPPSDDSASGGPTDPDAPSGSSAERTGSTQPGLRKRDGSYDIPRGEPTPRTFAQRWASSPFTQFG